MADNDGKGNGNSNYGRNNSRSNEESDNSDDDNVQGLSEGPDIGLGNIGHVRKSAPEPGVSG